MGTSSGNGQHRNGRSKSKSGFEDPCLIPGPVDSAVLQAFSKVTTEERERIVEYVEWQSPHEKVTFLQRVAAERLFERTLVAYDVQTTGERYWVITEPTNLYSQKLFPSLGYTITFHIGIGVRLMADRKPKVDDEHHDLLSEAWRKWTQAAEDLDSADEAESFQAVGMRCRECLLSMVVALASKEFVPQGQDAPKASDFLNWTDLIANSLVGGDSATEVRAYLKSMAKTTWQLASWLTHARNAVRYDAEIALDATQNTIAAYGYARLRLSKGRQPRCPKCRSYKVAESATEGLHCNSCGWEAGESN
jgi:hypothetical protein